jgi:3-hydroxyisobutyrate dehydrogenase-like beta-hydroxyacid dehydrogenase
MSRIGFIGVGLMGHGMVGSLLRAGHDLTVIAHRNRAPVDDLVSKGAHEATSLRQLAAGQDVIFLCVTGTPQIESIMAEIEPSLASGQIVVDTSTAIPESSVRIASSLAERGIGWADAPVGGGAQHAERGELASMVGARPEDFTRVEPWLRATSRVVQHMGGPGAGHRAKLLNNLLAVGQAALVIEAYKIAQRENLAWAKLFEVNMAGAARSGSLERIMVPALRGDFDGYVFTAVNAVKDLSYFTDYARALGEDTRLGSALRDYFSDAAAQYGDDTLLSQLLKQR